MEHFNHDWTDGASAIPQSVGDRYYAQDLNDDFNYLKHLPYEAILQGRSSGVMIPPTDTWNAETHSLTLSGGFGVTTLNIPVLDTEEAFVVPPKTVSSPRYERIGFVNTVLALPNDSNPHYIVATPVKKSLLQRTKALLSTQYACRTRYDCTIALQDTAPTSGQILIGLVYNDEYMLCKDFVLDQGKKSVKLHKWYGERKITSTLSALIQAYYNVTAPIQSDITVSNVHLVGEETTTTGISSGDFINCNIEIVQVTTPDTISQSNVINCIGSGTFNNCSINIGQALNKPSWIYNNIANATLNHCKITIDTNNITGIYQSTLNSCEIYSTTAGEDFISSSTLNNCKVSIEALSAQCLLKCQANNCIIHIDNHTGGDDTPKKVAIAGCNIHNSCIIVNTAQYIVMSGNVVMSSTIIVNTPDTYISGTDVLVNSSLHIEFISHSQIIDTQSSVTNCSIYIKTSTNTSFIVSATMSLVTIVTRFASIWICAGKGVVLVQHKGSETATISVLQDFGASVTTETQIQKAADSAIIAALFPFAENPILADNINKYTPKYKQKKTQYKSKYGVEWTVN